MNKLIKKVLVVDDSPLTEKIKIESYKQIIDKFKKESKTLNDFTVKFIWENSINGAIERLNNKLEVFHVMLIDYHFNNADNELKGTDLVKKIRKTINKRCKIVFYTMDSYNEIDKKDYIDLINSGIFKFCSKSSSDEEIVKGIIEAINEDDPISNALERFLVDNYEILKDTKIKVKGTPYTIKELIDSIRLETGPGKVFVNKMLKMTILEYVDFLE